MAMGDSGDAMGPVEFIQEVCARSIASGVMDMAKVRGCSEEEIAAAESKLGLQLPAYYRQFLLVLGKHGGGFMIGTHMFPRSADEFLGWRSFAVRLMRESEEALPSNAVVFGDHQGYQFWYFLADPASDDPPVFYYHEGEKRARQINNSFTEFVFRLVEECHADKQWLDEQRARTEAARAAFRAKREASGPDR
jgi:hypothetical protein